MYLPMKFSFLNMKIQVSQNKIRNGILSDPTNYLDPDHA
jgi:hypothetical protein